MLDIVFLGTGSGIPTKKRNPAAIWLQYEDNVMLWDCGEGTQKRMMQAKVSFMKIDRIFITHWHADHWAGLIGLMQTMNMEGRKNPLYIHGPEAERFIGDLLDLDYWGPRFRIISKNVPYSGEDVNHVWGNTKFDIYSIPVNHTVPAVAYSFEEKDKWNIDIKKAEKKYGLKQSPVVGKLKKEGSVMYKGKRISLKDVGYLKKGMKVVYTGDTKSCKNLDMIAKDSDILIHDTTFLDEKVGRMHSGAKAAANLAKKTKSKKLVLTHFSRRYQDLNPHIKEAKKIFKETVAARDLMRIKLKRD